MRAILRLLLMVLIASGPAISSASAQSAWYEVDADRNIHVHLYLFWSATCPHCPGAKEFADDLQRRQPWVRVYSYEISGNAENRAYYQQMAASLNRNAGQTPAFFYCKQMQIGYGSYEQTGRRIEQELVRWYDWLRENQKKPRTDAGGTGRFYFVSYVADEPPPPPLGDLDEPPMPPPPEPGPVEETVHIPGLGDVDAAGLSLPALTLVLAGCDALNPCAFFVLLLLLSLLVHGRSRPRMLLVGGTFVFFSGLMYFLFMAAWLNLFFLIGQLWLITTVAGAVAMIAAGFNLKDFFWPKHGPSLSIPDSAKPGLFQRMTKLINVSSVPSLLAGSAALAFAANLYELMCTSGFPMVYTRVLTLREMPVLSYYLYLVLYNLIYVAPMALIVVVFVYTLGSRKLTEHEGRALKLLSGWMMLAMGVVLVARPELLNSALGAAVVLGAALGTTALVLLVEHWWQRRHGATHAMLDHEGV